MPDWTAETPLRVVTGYHNIAKRFFAQVGRESEHNKRCVCVCVCVCVCACVYAAVPSCRA